MSKQQADVIGSSLRCVAYSELLSFCFVSYSLLFIVVVFFRASLLRFYSTSSIKQVTTGGITLKRIKEKTEMANASLSSLDFIKLNSPTELKGKHIFIGNTCRCQTSSAVMKKCIVFTFCARVG